MIRIHTVFILMNVESSLWNSANLNTNLETTSIGNWHIWMFPTCHEHFTIYVIPNIFDLQICRNKYLYSVWLHIHIIQSGGFCDRSTICWKGIQSKTSQVICHNVLLFVSPNIWSIFAPYLIEIRNIYCEHSGQNVPRSKCSKSKLSRVKTSQVKMTQSQNVPKSNVPS